MRAFSLPIALVFCLAIPVHASGADREDILVADFEGDTYGDWKTSGEAFGPGPAKGTLTGQMHVAGYRGKGLVNSFFKGDRTTGDLTSPPLKVERRFLVFLIGGGGYKGTTCMNLLLDGKVVRSAAGHNSEPGGSEELSPSAWDVADLQGKTVTIQIVDKRTGGWGHVNVDHIVQSDTKPAIPKRPGSQTRELQLTKRFLLFPIRNGAKKSRVDLSIDGEMVRQFDAELARTTEETSFWSFLDISDFAGKSATLLLSSATEEGAALIEQSDELPAREDLYDEALRPQLRFSQMLGWNNDPNGMVYYDGEWHLYFQHNPYGWKWGNMHWGHAISKDLIHWEQLPIAIYNYRRGDWAFSGGAVVDEKNTAGWQTGKEKVIVASWTSTGRGECLAYSNDRGRTFTEYEGNPVVKHKGRDPKIIWYEPGKHWVMAVYSDHAKKRTIAFHSSKNLKDWKLESHLNDYFECPEILELPVDGDANDTRWVVFAADARYAVGKFDGKVFTPLHEGKRQVHHGSYYASQMFSNVPDGRRIQIGWARVAMPGMPFNQAFTFPHRLTLRTTAEGVRLFAEPVREIEKLYQRKHGVEDKALTADKPIDVKVSGELFDVRASFEIDGATTVGLDIGGNRIVYDVKARKLNGAALAPVDGKVEIRVLVDRSLLEIIGNRGRVYITSRRGKRGDVAAIRAFAEGGAAKLILLEAHELESIWKTR
jgi:fructan beta-fructosidase